MKKLAALIATLGLMVTAPAVMAGSPHFVGTPTVAKTGNTLTVSGKIAGLGNEDQVSVRVSAEASCVNRGGHNPSAANKDSFSSVGQFPVQNGKANFSLTLTATFSPSCSPPMSVVWMSPVLVEDLTHGISTTVPVP